MTKWQKRSVRYRKSVESLGWKTWHPPMLIVAIVLVVAGLVTTAPASTIIAIATTCIGTFIPYPKVYKI